MLTEIFGKCPQVKTINFLLAHPFHKYTKKEMAQGSEISRMTLDKFIEDFVELRILIKDGGLYFLNSKSNLVNLMDKLQLSLADMVERKELNRLLDLEQKYNNYAKKQIELTSELSKAISKKELSHL